MGDTRFAGIDVAVCVGIAVAIGFGVEVTIAGGIGVTGPQETVKKTMRNRIVQGFVAGFIGHSSFI